MQPLALPYALALLATATLSASLALFSFSHQGQQAGTRTFAGLLVALTWLAGITGMEMLAPTLEGKLLAEKLGFAGTAALSPLWLVLALRYTRYSHWLTRRNQLLLALPSVIAFGLALTNDSHHLVWESYRLDPLSPALVVNSFGTAFRVFLLFHYGFILLAAFIYALAFSQAAHVYRQQIGLMIAGALIPLLGNAIYLLNVYPVPGVDLTPFAFGLSAVLLATGLFRFGLLDLQPIAARVVINHLTDAVVVLDMQERVIDFNPAGRKLLALDDKAIGKPAPTVLRASVNTTRTDDGSAPADVQLGDEDPRRWYRITISWLRDNFQRPVGRVALLRDVTDERMLQRLRNDLTHMLIHDLSNPLSAMHMALEMVQISDGAAGQPLTASPESREALEIVRRSSQRAQRMIASLLDVSRLESGHMPLEIQAVNAGAIVQSAVRDMRPWAEERGLVYDVRLRPELPPVRADAELLERVFRNLLSNAIKFTPRGGQVLMTADAAASEVTFTVSDTGNGLPVSVQARLFEKFVRGTASQQGHGLGLAFCKLAIEAMGGRIWADSQPGLGAAFHFTLPRA